MSHDTSGRSALERHNEEMKVSGFAGWLFGPQGGTVDPAFAPVTHDHNSHDDQHVSEAFAGFFKDSPASTDAEYQQILGDRAANADLSQINIPAGYAPVTFIEDDIIVVAEKGKNLRDLCLENNIPLYGDMMQYLNCRGLGLCTSCRVSADPNDALSAPTAMEKVHLIRDNPKYRLACQCTVEGPVKVSTKPAKDYGATMRNVIRNSALFGIFSLVMALLLLVMGLDVAGFWF